MNRVQEAGLEKGVDNKRKPFAYREKKYSNQLKYQSSFSGGSNAGKRKIEETENVHDPRGLVTTTSQEDGKCWYNHRFWHKGPLPNQWQEGKCSFCDFRIKYADDCAYCNRCHRDEQWYCTRCLSKYKAPWTRKYVPHGR